VVVQNWLAKNPYYIVSYAAEENQSNGGGGDRGDRLHRDYLWDRPDIHLSNASRELNGGISLSYSPAKPTSGRTSWRLRA